MAATRSALRRPALLGIGAGLAVTALVLSGCAGRESSGGDAPDAAACDPGFTETEVRIGVSVPMSGPAAAYGPIGTAVQAYFDDVNEAGGLEFADGVTRDVVVTVMDDGYDPAKTAVNVRQLVEQDEVFALAGVLGTGAAIATSEYVTEEGVPYLYAGTGSDAILALSAESPYTTGFMPQYDFEVQTLSDYILATDPDATVAILYQNDEFGESIRSNFEARFAGTGVEIVAEESYEVASGTVDSQVTNLADSGADWFLDWAVGTFATQSLKKKAELGWDATTVINAPAADATFFLLPAGEGASDGVVSIAYAKDITDASLAGDPGWDAYAAFAEAHADEYDPRSVPAAAGYSTAQLLELALANMDGCTRDALIESASSFDGETIDLLPNDVTISTSPEYPYVFSELKVQIFNGANWELQDEVFTKQ
ncbi:ABC transporter substrate-binding protein [Agromyces sp. SYSU T00194]|uniref:ABC transporter substrate-binding protein n=1 Tax=Agromyces chitinivorans TaxID=3158560 RepID=UPI00339ACD76